MNWIQRVFYIKDTTDYAQTGVAISNGIHVKGLNVWLMICSALLASIGLDTNSTAVIIGAMLISPLMSPILGAGYSVGVQDKELFIRSINNLAYITFFSLLTSVVYFTITPLGQPTSEILARTQPTVLDIGVAFFGGVAGIVSASRREKTNALPGVAIATALMPPLCAAGFGLAKGKWAIFGGAFYLFFINAAFIALSTFLIVKLLRFPIKSYVEKEKEKRVGRLATLVLVLVSIPSFLFLYGVYKNNKTQRMIENEVISDFHDHGNEILKWEIEDQDSIKMVKAFFSGTQISDADRNYYNDKLKALGLKDYRVRFFRMNMSKNEMNKMSSELSESILKNIEMQTAKMRDSMQQASSMMDEEVVYNEIRAFYPNISGLAVTQIAMKTSTGTDTIWSAWLQWDTLSKKIKKDEAVFNIRRYLNTRLNTDTVWLQQVDQLKIQNKK